MHYRRPVASRMRIMESQKVLHRALEDTLLADFLFYCAFAFFSFAEILNSTAFGSVVPGLGALCTAVLYVSIAMLFLRLFILEASAAQWFLVLAIAGLAALLYKLYGLQYPLWIFLFVVSGKGVNFSTLAKITLVVAGALTAITLLACYVGLITNYSMPATDTRSVRYSMGFVHPNRLGERIAEICIAYWYLYGREHRFRTVVVCLVAFLYIDSVSNSRTSSMVFILLIFAALLYPLLVKAPRFSILACGTLVATSVFLSFYFMVHYDPSSTLMASINEALSGRLCLMNASYCYAAPSLFGNDYSGAPVMGYTVATHEVHHFLVDNAYGHLLLQYGIAASVLFFMLIFLVFYRHYCRRVFTVPLLGLTMMLIVGFVENFTLDIQYNYFLLLMADVVFASRGDSGSFEGNKPESANNLSEMSGAIESSVHDAGA